MTLCKYNYVKVNSINIRYAVTNLLSVYLPDGTGMQLHWIHIIYSGAINISTSKYVRTYLCILIIQN